MGHGLGCNPDALIAAEKIARSRPANDLPAELDDGILLPSGLKPPISRDRGWKGQERWRRSRNRTRSAARRNGGVALVVGIT
jgi:hypothetical protein